MIWRRTPTPCCYTDANGSSCHCQRAKIADAALATARADALREAASLTPYDIDGYPAGKFTRRVFVKVDAILALIQQEKPHE